MKNKITLQTKDCLTTIETETENIKEVCGYALSMHNEQLQATLVIEASLNADPAEEGGKLPPETESKPLVVEPGLVLHECMYG